MADIDGRASQGGEEIYPDASRVLAPKLRRLINIWHAARDGGARPPRKSLIDPIDLGRARLLAWIWLVERRPDRALVYRLAGEEINAVFGRSIARASLQELLAPAEARMIERRWHRVLDDRVMLHTVGDVYSETGNLYSGERIALPLTDEAGVTRFLIGATDYRLIGPDDRAIRPSKAGVQVVHRGFTPIDRIEPLPVADEPEATR